MEKSLTCPACGDPLGFGQRDAACCPRCQEAISTGGPSSHPPGDRVSPVREPTGAADPGDINPYAAPANETSVGEPSTERRTGVRMSSEEETEDDGRLPLAPRLVRLGGALVDMAVMIVFGVGAIVAFGSEYEEPDQLRVLGFQGFAVSFVIQGFLIGFRGQSLGKMAFGMRIANVDDDEIPDFVRSVLVRTWLPVLLTLIPFFKLIDILCIYNAEHRCLHDFMAGTRVVDIRGESVRL